MGNVQVTIICVARLFYVIALMNKCGLNSYPLLSMGNVQVTIICVARLFYVIAMFN